MAKFVFKLRAVLTQRSWIERQRQLELARAHRALEASKADLARLEQEVRDANDFARSLADGSKVPVPLLVQHRRYLLGAQQRMLEAATQIERNQQEIRDAQAALAEAARRRRAIELLRDRQLERWRAEQARKEIEQLDEAGMQIAFDHLSGTDGLT